MSDQKQKVIKNITGRRQIILPVSIIIIGLLMNMGGKLVASLGGLPIYLDTPGTIMVAFLGGYVPGMAVALISNIIGNLMDGVSIYYAPVSVLIAVVTVHFSRKGLLDRIRNNVIYVLILAFIGGGIGGILTWYLNLQGVNSYNAGIIHFLQGMGMGEFFPWFIANILFDIIDKTVTVIFVRIIVYLIPQDQWSKFELVGWMQEPFYISREKSLFKFGFREWNLNTKIITILGVFSVMTATVCTSVCLMLFIGHLSPNFSYTVE